jgi:hypothetical protein
MEERANPYAAAPLHEEASVNRQRLLAVPPFGEGYRGRLAYDVLCRDALIELVLAEFPDLATAADPLLHLAGTEGEPGFDRVALEFARRMATLVYVLLDKGRENRASRPQWTEGAWQFWSSRETIWLAGGLMEGRFGELVARGTQLLVGDRPLIRQCPYPRYMPLIGAARSVRFRDQARVLDFGQTTLKRGTAEFRDGSLVVIRLEEGLPVPPNPEVSVMEDLLASACQGWSGPVGMSMACYNSPEGGPIHRGTFNQLYERTDHVPTYLERFLGVESLVMVHDGTAAARALAGNPRSVVIVLGTALGIGVVPESDEGLAGLDADFRLTSNAN